MIANPWPIRAYHGLARWLLPRPYYRRYGAYTVELFADVYRQRRGSLTRAGVLRLCLREYAALTRTALREQVDRVVPAARPARTNGSPNPRKKDFMQTLRTILADTRLAIRLLRKHPSFTIVATLTLAVGIGANTAIFSLVNGTLLRPLPYEDPHELVLVWERFPVNDLETVPLDDLDYLDYREQNSTFAHLGIFATTGATFETAAGPERIGGMAVSTGIFEAIRARPAMGRLFDRDDERPGAGAIILSDHTWRTRFDARPDILGHTIRLTDSVYTIVGVLPAEFSFPPPVTLWNEMVTIEEPEFYRPIALDRSQLEWGTFTRFALGRLRPGVTAPQAQADLAAIAQRIEETQGGVVDLDVNVVPIHAQSVATIRPSLLMLLGAVGFVLLIVCANVANLMLVRAGVREREIAVRLSLGAGRRRIVGQLLTESLVLAAVGGLLGLAMAFGITTALVALSPIELPAMFSPDLDLAVLGFTVVVTVVTGVAFGIVPAVQVSRLGLNTVLREGGRSGMSGARHSFTKSALVVAEVAVAALILIGAGLVVRSFTTLMQVDPGFRAENLVTFGFFPPPNRFATDGERRQFLDRALTRVHQIPGVEAATVTNFLPFSTGRAGTGYRVEGQAPSEADVAKLTEMRQIDGNHLPTMGIPLVRGRNITGADGADAPLVALINERFAEREFAGRDPIGQRIARRRDTALWLTIVGVVADVREFGLRREAELTVYVPYQQDTPHGSWFVVRAAGDLAGVRAAIPAAMREIDPTTPLVDVQTMEEAMGQSVSAPRFVAFVFAAFGTIALLLSAIGIYGVIAYSVSRSTREIGVRMAFGAQTEQVLGMVLRRALILAAIGTGLGLGGGLALNRVLAGLLFEVSVTDPLTYAAVPLGLLSVAAVAALLPAWRATRVQPMEALRE